MELNGSQFSKLVGVSRQAISKAWDKDERLVKNKNGKYDLRDKLNSDYLFSHGVTKTDIENFILGKNKKPKKKPEKKKVEPSPPKEKKLSKKEIALAEIKNKLHNDLEPEEEFENITGLPAQMMKLTLSKLVNRYGGPMMLKNWADILNKLFSANEKDQKIQMKKLDLIDKEFVISRLFSYLETLHNQIFNIPLSLSDHIIALALSKKEKARTDVINYLKLEIEKVIKDAKESINDELDSLKNKFDKLKIEDEN